MFVVGLSRFDFKMYLCVIVITCLLLTVAKHILYPNCFLGLTVFLQQAHYYRSIHPTVFYENVFLKISQNSQENTCNGVLCPMF